MRSVGAYEADGMRMSIVSIHFHPRLLQEMQPLTKA